MKRGMVVLAGLAAAELLVASGAAIAAGFQLDDDGASGLGNAFAGRAAVADDASTIYDNPASMSRLHGNQVALTVQAIQPSFKFSPDGRNQGAVTQTAGGNGGDAGSLAAVPNVHFVTEVNPQLKFGLSLNVPFGLQTSYDPTWVGRFQAISSRLQTVNLNPSFSYQVNDILALGAGVSYQHITGELSQAVNYSALIGGTNLEGVSTVTGSDSKLGYNFGALINLDAQTRIGFAYRSKIKYNLVGNVTFTNVPGVIAGNPLVANGGVSLALAMPDSFSASAVHAMSGETEVMADLTWTGWSVVQQMNLVRSNGTLLSSTPEYWRNTWRASLGVNHRYNEAWLWRMGTAYDQSPITDYYRNARLPDTNRIWLALGGQYKSGKESAVDFAYVHLFMNSVPIYQNQAATGAGVLSGNYAFSVNIASVQYTQKF